MTQLNQDSLLEVFMNFSLKEKFRYMLINKECSEVIKAALRRQKRLGHVAENDQSNCNGKGHQITSKDILPHPFLDNIGPKEKLVGYMINVMKMCPNVTIIKLILRNRINDTSYSNLFETIVDLYGNKLECLEITTIPKTIARMEEDQQSQIITEYDTLLAGCPSLKHMIIPVVSDNGFGNFLDINQQVELVDIFRLQGVGVSLKKLPPTVLTLVMTQPTAQGFAGVVESEAMRSIEHLDFHAGRTGLRNEHQFNFVSLKELKLHGKGAGFTVGNFKLLAKSTKLENINLSNFACSRAFLSSDFKPLFENCPGLKSIRMNSDAICDNFFLYLANCKKLETLQISSYGFAANVSISDIGVYEMAKLIQLRTLEIEYFGGLTVTAEALMKLLDGCQLLERFVLKRSNSIMLTPQSRRKLLELVDKREGEGKNYVVECEHRVGEMMARFYATLR